jgi:hypothetical protein
MCSNFAFIWVTNFIILNDNDKDNMIPHVCLFFLLCVHSLALFREHYLEMGLRQHTHFDSLNRACITSFEPYHTLRWVKIMKWQNYMHEKEIILLFENLNYMHEVLWYKWIVKRYCNFKSVAISHGIYSVEQWYDSLFKVDHFQKMQTVMIDDLIPIEMLGCLYFNIANYSMKKRTFV